MLKSVVRPQDFMLSLDVESAYFHVPIHPKHRKFFSTHLAVPLFVNNKFIEPQTGGYFVCSRPDLAPLVPSAQTPPHLRHHYHQVIEFSHVVLPFGWTSVTRIWTSVMSVVAAALRRHGMRTLLYVDDLLIACSSFEEASRTRQIIEDTLLVSGIVRAPLKGCFDTPTQTLPDHLGFIISSMGKGALLVPERRCFSLRRQARTLLFETVKNRRLVDSDLLRCFSGAAISCLPAVPLARFHLREVFNAQEQYKSRSCLSQATVDNLFFWRNFSDNIPENLQELWPDQPSTALYTDASGTTGWGSVLEPPHEATRSSAGWWASQEVLEMITLKELKTCRHGLHQNVEALTPVEDRRIKEGIPKETVVKESFWRMRPDGITVLSHVVNTTGIFCILEHKRMSDVCDQYLIRAKSTAENQYASLRSAISTVIHRQGWRVEQVIFTTGTRSVNKQDLSKNLKFFKVPEASINSIYSKLAMRVFDVYANTLKCMYSTRFSGGATRSEDSPNDQPTPFVVTSLTHTINTLPKPDKFKRQKRGSPEVKDK
jgi:hypothetical protein